MTLMYNRPQGAPPLASGLCIKCGAELKNVEIGLTKKMVNRGIKEYMCLKCLSEFTGVSKQELLDKAAHFKKMGCILF